MPCLENPTKILKIEKKKKHYAPQIKKLQWWKIPKNPL